ncbi:MAG: FecR family protein [Candidatus Nitrotoga sp. SPKER]|nr:MAG: FecR family protein [Candidatus Nitrotoga sp. SPKER]
MSKILKSPPPSLSDCVEKIQPTSLAVEEYKAVISWSVKLSSGRATESDYEQFKLWRASDPANEAAWQKLQALEANVVAMPKSAKSVAVEALDAATQARSTRLGRRKAVKMLSLGILGLTTSAYLLNNIGSWNFVASYDTRIGKKIRIQLADGTNLLLNTNTQIEVHYSWLKREILFNTGEIYIETGQDRSFPIGRRPFWVQTAHAGLKAIGTRFAVEQDTSRTRLHVSEGTVAIHTSDEPVYAYANETYAIFDDKPKPVKTLDATFDPVAWVDGVLVAREMRLDAFVTELTRYESILITCDKSVADLRVSGVFQLNRPDPVNHALMALVKTLPVQLVQQTPVGITIIKK